jgi:hypothetical protein
MAARVIPYEENLVAKTVTITATDATPEGCILQAGQGVTFTNNSGSPVTITFNPTNMFGASINLTASAPGNSYTAPGPAGSGSVNYYITVGANPNPNGPYAIQAGAGPMYVVVSGSVGNEKVSPDPVAIPVGGTLQMNPSLSTNKYSVGTWTNGDPFIVPLTTVDSTPHTDNTSDGPGQFPYTATRTSIEGGGGNGKGTVIVRST